jgi:hypothetical protein
MSDTSGWGTARKMIELYGAEAQNEARRRSQKALERDDLIGSERWAQIAAAIGGRFSRPATPDPAEPVHSAH